MAADPKLRVMEALSVMLPNQKPRAELSVESKVTGSVRAEKSIAPATALALDPGPTVPPEAGAKSSMIMVSWGSGIFAAAPVPPEDVAQLAEYHAAPEAPTQYTVFGVEKVMPELPPPSPTLVPVKLPPEMQLPAKITS